MGKFCTNCGTKIDDDQEKCMTCGKVLKISKSSTSTDKTSQATNGKNKVVAGLLGVFLGGLGVHNFYLGFQSKAVAQLLITIFGSPICGIGPVISGVWGFVEGIMILTGSINKDAEGNDLVD